METIKIFVVEDEAIIAMELTERLTQMGYAVVGSAAQAESALAYVEIHRPDIVMMDIHIKGAKDGIQTAAEMRERFSIPVIYLTAHADQATLQRAAATEPYGYLIKPFRPQELQATIEMAVHKHRMEQQLRQREAQLRAITANLPGIVFQFFARPDGSMGVSFAEGKITEVFGIAPEVDTLFTRFVEGVDPRDRPALFASISDAVQNSKPWEFEGRFIIPSGKTIWFRGLSTPTQRGQDIDFTGLLLDITEHKRAEEKSTP